MISHKEDRIYYTAYPLDVVSVDASPNTATAQKRITELLCLPFTYAKKISDFALDLLRRFVDPWVFDMSMGGGCGGGYTRNELNGEWSALLTGSNGSSHRPLGNAVPLTITTLGSEKSPSIEIDAMSLHYADGAPTIVMSFGVDTTYALSAYSMLSLCHHLQRLNMNLLLIDLPNHGNSKGKATEDSCNDSLRSAYRFVQTEWKVPDNHMFFLGESLSSGVVGSLVEEHPDINPIFVDGYAHLKDVVSTTPIIGPLLKLLFRALYSLNTIKALQMLRGNACIIASQQDALFGDSHLMKMMQTARQAQQAASYIMINNQHGEKDWMTNPTALSQLSTYLETTLAKSKERNQISDLCTLVQYFYRHRQTLSIEEKYALAKDAQRYLLKECNSPGDFTESKYLSFSPDEWVGSNMFFRKDIIWELLKGNPLSKKYGIELTDAFYEIKYKAAFEAGDKGLAKQWIDAVPKDSMYGKVMKAHWASQNA